MQNDDHHIQGIDDSENRQVPNNRDIVHHIENLNYEVYINSFYTHKFKMQDNGNQNNCRSLSLAAYQLYLTKRGHLSDQWQLLRSQHLQQSNDD